MDGFQLMKIHLQLIFFLPEYCESFNYSNKSAFIVNVVIKCLDNVV